MNTEKVVREVTRRTAIPNIFIQLGIEHIAEVGVWRGDNFRRMIRPSCIVSAWAIDAWDTEILERSLNVVSNQALNEQYYNTMVQLCKTDKRVRVFRGDSLKAAKILNGLKFDFIYIDADHTYEGCLADLIAYYPLLRNGGILSGHDYTTAQGFGVKQAVDDFRKANKLDFFHRTKEKLPSWFLVKGAA